MVRLTVPAFVTAALAAAAAASAQAPVCVENSSAHNYFFAAEAADGTRAARSLAPGERLCAEGGESGARGVVSVFENAAHLEGCSRLTQMGQTETLVRYSDFDRCEWGSHSE